MRYADDIAIFTSSERSSKRVLESVIKWIEKNLKLPVNRSKSGNSTTGNGSLLGFKIHPDGGIDISDKS